MFQKQIMFSFDILKFPVFEYVLVGEHNIDAPKICDLIYAIKLVFISLFLKK